MNSKFLTLFLVALCIALGGWIYYGLNNQTIIDPISSIEASPNLDLKESPEIFEPELADIEDFSEVIERPLFSATRQEEEEVTAEDITPERKPAIDPRLKLLGIVISGDEQIALIKSRKDPKAKRVRINEKIEGWKLNKLEKNSANLILGKQEITLTMSRKSDPKKRRSLKKPSDIKLPSQNNNLPFQDQDDEPMRESLAPGSPVSDVEDDE